MESLKALKRISLEGKCNVFLSSEYTARNKLELKILNMAHNEAFMGQANDIELRSQAAAIRLSFSDFLVKTRKALFDSDSSEGEINLYHLSQNNDSYVFRWQITDGRGTYINIGSVNMDQKNSESILNETLCDLSHELGIMRAKFQTLSKELKESEDNTAEALKQLTTANEMKSRMEKEMFSKFILVLNEKKRKIRELKTGPSTFQSKKQQGKAKTAQNGAVKSKINNKRGAIHQLSESEESGTDDPGPSTSSKRNTSLFLDESNSEEFIRCGEMRNRKAIKNVVKKESPVVESGASDSATEMEDSEELFAKM